jgi:phosphoribosylaminoimidazole-succinocarboxamide synthase
MIVWSPCLELRKGKLLSETDETKTYSTAEPGQIIVRYKDEIKDLSKKNPIKVKGKGQHAGAIADTLYSYVEGYHIPTHYIRVNKPAEIVIKETDPIPIEITIWNFAVNSLSKRYGFKRNMPLPCTIVEYFLKVKKSKNPMISFDHACALEIVTQDEMHRIDQLARKTNAVLKSFVERREFKLIYFSVEFGRYEDRILLTGDLGLSTLHLWDISDAGSPQDILHETGPALDSAYGMIKDRICK